MPLEGFIGPNIEDEKRHIANSWWRNVTFGDVLDEAAEKYNNTDYILAINQVLKSNPTLKHIINVWGKENNANVSLGV